MNFDLLPGSYYTGKEFPSKWMLLGGGGTSCLTNQNLLPTPLNLRADDTTDKLIALPLAAHACVG